MASASRTARRIPTLPNDLVMEIALGTSDASVLAIMQQICTDWRDVCNRNAVWWQLALKKFPRLNAILKVLPAGEKDAKRVYREQLALEGPCSSAPPPLALKDFAITVELYWDDTKDLAHPSWTGILTEEEQRSGPYSSSSCGPFAQLWDEQSRPGWMKEFEDGEQSQNGHERPIDTRVQDCLRMRLFVSKNDDAKGLRTIKLYDAGVADIHGAQRGSIQWQEQYEGSIDCRARMMPWLIEGVIDEIFVHGAQLTVVDDSTMNDAQVIHTLTHLPWW